MIVRDTISFTQQKLHRKRENRDHWLLLFLEKETEEKKMMLAFSRVGKEFSTGKLISLISSRKKRRAITTTNPPTEAGKEFP